MLGGTGNGIQWVSVMTALQEATPPDYQARVVGLLESALAAMPGVGYLIGGILTAVGSPRTAYAVAGDRHAACSSSSRSARSAACRLGHPRAAAATSTRPSRPTSTARESREVSFETGER